MVPDGWVLSELCGLTKEKISYGIVQAGPHVEGGIPYIKSSNVRGEIKLTSLQRTSEEIHYKYRRSSVHPGDIVFSLRGNIGQAAILPKEISEANLTQGTARISTNKENDKWFVYHQITSVPVLNRINQLSKGSTFKEISLAELRKVKILVPPLKEQNKIAKILTTWDKAITTTEKLLANSQQQKKALMQQLLTGKKRFNGFEVDWKDVHLKDIVDIRKGRALSSKDLNPGKYPVIAGGKSSPYNHNEYTHENIITISASGAYAGFVAYHSHKIWASDCSVVREKEGESIGYVYQFLKSYQKKIYSLQSGGAQPHIYPKDLNVIKLKVPSYKEQEKISLVLSIVDREIDLFKCKVEFLKKEKKALMQQLLTGKRRVIV